VLEDAASTDLFRAIREVAGGGSFLSPAIGQKLLEEHLAKRFGDGVISEQEKQQEIAQMLQRMGAPAEILDSILDAPV
jgi:DNA-binding NarL/FixJ family response regulator